MNIWPQHTLQHWIHRAQQGETVRVMVTAEIQLVWRGTDPLPRRGYELYGCYQVASHADAPVIRKPSVSFGGFADDPPEVIGENAKIANQRLERDCERLRKAGIGVTIESRFSGKGISQALGGSQA